MRFLPDILVKFIDEVNWLAKDLFFKKRPVLTVKSAKSVGKSLPRSKEKTSYTQNN